MAAPDYDERDLDLASLGLLHLKDKPAELKAALDAILAERARFEAEGEKELAAIRARRSELERPSKKSPPAAAPEAPAAKNSGKKSSTLLIASKVAGTCATCRHANQGTADFAEKRVYCELDQKAKALDYRCDVVRQLPTSTPIRAKDAPKWPSYFLYEPYNGDNGTWGRLEDMRMLAEDAADSLKRELRSDLPIIDGD